MEATRRSSTSSCRNMTGFLVVLAALLVSSEGLELRNGAYDELVFKISPAVPVQDCRIVLDNLEATLTSASQYLFSALDSRAFLRLATVLLPPSWPDSCASSPVISGSGEAPDVTVLPKGPTRGRIYTQQSLGCGQPGDQIYLAYESLMQRDGSLARSFVKEFAMYRYGVFEEQGYYNDPIYPMCFYDDQAKKAKATGCSDLPIHDNGICSDPKSLYNTTNMVDERARTSIMFAPEAPSVSMFCDEGNHDRFAPTKHNSICQRRSVFDVIINHSDFAVNPLASSMGTNQITDTTPKFIYKKQNLTRYVFVLENTKDMMQRESWSYLRLALRFWTLNTLPSNSEIGMVLAEETSKRALNIISVNSGRTLDTTARDSFYSAIPYTPGDAIQPGCLHCSVKDAVDMLNERTKSHGPASSVIVVIAAGMNPSQQLEKTLAEARKAKIRIAAINYPNIVRPLTLNALAEASDGVAYTIFEQKLNVETTLLSTYFELHNVLLDIVQRYYSGGEGELPMEVHRREITDDGRNSITGSFMLDPSMGQPAKFTFFTHNSVTPLIKSLKLISPSHQVFANRNDKYIDFKMILLNANISEIGTWTYTVEPYLGNPQPHFLQVTATPVSAVAPVIRAKFWTHRNSPNAPLILLAEVKKGELPVLGAKVEVSVTRAGVNGSAGIKTKFELLDTGAGDPDITRGDGVYTRYFSASESGPGLYSFEVTVSDNGNTAYTWTESAKYEEDKPCCGSTIPSPGVTPISPFQRVLPKITLQITTDQISAPQAPVGRVGDLRVQIIPEDMKARLTWTSPDMGGHAVSRYEVKYSQNILDIVDNFETIAKSWNSGQPFPLAPGSETTFNVDMSQNRELLDKPLYFAIKAYPKFSSDVSGPVSNFVRVLVPSPPPPPTVPPTYTSNEQGYWPGSGNSNGVGVDPVSPSIAKSVGIGLELILPIAIGFILLVVLLVLYCYFCVVKRRDHRQPHKNGNGSKNDKLSSTITIVPSTPQNTHQSYERADMPDPHQVGVPINYEYEEDTKKRYSLVNQQEQQLIEELKQQQQMAQHMGVPPTYSSGLSVISTGTLNRNGHTLSPYNSWSASQLLHEHERRHSPLNQDEMNPHQELLPEHMGHHPPPVPPLPAFTPNGYPINYNIYGVQQQPPNPIYQSMQPPFNPSGSLSSVNSGDKKRRNVTMV